MEQVTLVHILVKVILEQQVMFQLFQQFHPQPVVLVQEDFLLHLVDLVVLVVVLVVMVLLDLVAVVTLHL